jgi:hypothetical protein
VNKLFKESNELFPKYMRRCIFEYTTNNKKSIKKEDGKQFIEDIFIAVEIEKAIDQMIKRSNCQFNKTEYSANLVSAISRMYEVN